MRQGREARAAPVSRVGQDSARRLAPVRLERASPPGSLTLAGRTPQDGVARARRGPGCATMVTMRNRLTTTTAALATTALLTLGLAACSGSGDDAASDASPSASAATSDGSPSADETATTGTDEPGAEETSAAGTAGGICGAQAVLTELQTDMAAADPSDPSAAAAQLEEHTAELEAMEPPAEVAEDWGVLTSGFRSLTDAMAAVAADPAAADPNQLTDTLSLVTNEDFQRATQSVFTYTATNC